MRLSRLVRVRLLTAVLAGVLWFPASAAALDVPFLFLIPNGWSTLLAAPATRPAHGLFSWSVAAPFHSVVNGQKGAAAGNAFVVAWSRSANDPYFDPLRPLSGLVTLDFGTFRGHLGLVETPAGLQTTIGIVDDNGLANAAVSGVWALGDGSAVGGGSSSDLTVAGLVHFGTPGYLGTIPVDITQYFPMFPNAVATDPEPFIAVGVSGPATQTVSLGSFYGYAQGPLRTLRRLDTQTNGFSNDASLMVMAVGGGNYAVLACTNLGLDGTDGYLDRCTLSGLGPVLGRLTGTMTGRQPWWILQWQAFLAP
jgi:hypothetical protein